MVSPKSLQACEKQSINDWSFSWAWVATAASSANSMSLMRSLRTFVLALRRARLKSLLSDRVRQAKESPKKHWNKDSVLFDATVDFECLREAAIELHCSLRVSMERLDHAL